MSVDEQFLANDLTQPSDAFTVSAIREQLTVEKRLVETGAIRVRKLVHEDLVTVNTPLTGEISKINRIKFDTVVTGPVPIRHEGDVMIVSIMEERLVTYTELVLVEEIHITRRSTQHSATQEVKIRREEVVIERLDLSSGEWRIVKDDPSTQNS